MNKQVEYFENGEVRKEYFLNEEHRIDGVFREYYENGEVLVDCQYKDGKVDGEANIYNDRGELFLKYHYENGQIIKMMKIFKN